jgi:serine/threonine-protein kinase
MRSGSIVVGRYRIERVLDSGGMGVVVLATQLVTEQPVVLKVMHMHGSTDVSSTAVKRFAREARAAAMLQSEHVARVLDVSFLDSGEPYIAMEYLEGRDLGRIIDEHGPASVTDAVDWVIQVLEALAEAHLLGLIHRDIKPRNLFLTRRRQDAAFVKVLDFGVVKLTTDAEGDSLTGSSALLGSISYMSPERFLSARDVDVRADIWSVGVTLYELLEGHNPFATTSMASTVRKIMSGELPPFSRQEIPEGLERIVRRCLERDPEGRYPNIFELAGALHLFGSPAAIQSAARIERMRVTMGREQTEQPAAASKDEIPRPNEDATEGATLEPSIRLAGRLRAAISTNGSRAHALSEAPGGASSALAFFSQRATLGLAILACVLCVLALRRQSRPDPRGAHRDEPAANGAGSTAEQAPSAQPVARGASASAVESSNVQPVRTITGNGPRRGSSSAAPHSLRPASSSASTVARPTGLVPAFGGRN